MHQVFDGSRGDGRASIIDLVLPLAHLFREVDPQRCRQALLYVELVFQCYSVTVFNFLGGVLGGLGISALGFRRVLLF